MYFQVNGLEISALHKSSNPDVITVDIVANHLTEDDENETVLKEAFSPETVQNFLNVGVVEFWHESKNPLLTKEEKNKYLIGKPIAFRWENHKPIVTADLTKTHPIVQEMYPHLKAGQPVYAASLGGGKTVLEAQDSEGRKHRIIPRINWDHLAIAPSNSVINRAPGLNVRLLQKSKDIMLECDNMQVFKKSGFSYIEKEEELKKALMAPGSVSDLSNTPGGSVTKQSLEIKPVALTFDENEGLDIIDTILGMKNKSVPMKKAEFMKSCEARGKRDFGVKFMRLIDKYFKLKEQN